MAFEDISVVRAIPRIMVYDVVDAKQLEMAIPQMLNYDGIVYPYNAQLGAKSSSTGNVYGVYDMSGGAYENVMANYNNNLEKGDYNNSIKYISERRHIYG